MSQILSEVPASNRSCASNFADKSKLALPPLRNSHLHGRKARPRQICWTSRGRCERHPQYGWRGGRRCHPVPRDQLQTAGHTRIHTDRGMELFTNEVLHVLLASSLEAAELITNRSRDVGRRIRCRRVHRSRNY
jgi:hypothetical protein